MDQLQQLGVEVDWPDSEASGEVRDRLAELPGLGRLAGLAEWIAGVRAPGATLSRIRLVVIGEPPPEVVVETALAVGADVRVIAPESGDGSIARAIETGSDLADAEAEQGTELLIVAVPTMQADAAIAVSALTNTEPIKVLTRGMAATDPETWMRTALEVRDGRRRCMPVRDDADKLLAEIGSERLAVAAGLVLRSATRRTPVLLDGPVAAAAALIAYEAQPRAVRWWAAADRGSDPVHELAQTRLGQRPVLGLDSGLGDGLAGLLAVPVIRAAALLAANGPEEGS